jgi:hypothetical protein
MSNTYYSILDVHHADVNWGNTEVKTDLIPKDHAHCLGANSKGGPEVFMWNWFIIESSQYS